MKMVALKLINVIVLFVYFVKCSDVNEKTVDKKVSNAVQIPRTHFNNRPPSAVDSIPVVVVFEEEKRKEKSVDLSVGEIKNSKNSRNQNETKTSTESSNSENNTEQILSISKDSQKQEPKFSKSTVESVDLKDIITVNETKTSTETVTVKTNTKQDPIQKIELQIPVAVIYDPEPKDVVNNDNLNRRRQSKKIENSENNKLNTQSTTAENNKINMTTNSSRNLRNKIQVPILHSENFVYSHNGDFHYSYEGGDGTKAYERGKLKSIDDNTGEAVVGSFSYVGKDGNDYSLSYTADENGYRPVGAHLPTPPPIPPAIARALKYLATKTTSEPVTEPSKR